MSKNDRPEPMSEEEELMEEFELSQTETQTETQANSQTSSQTETSGGLLEQLQTRMEEGRSGKLEERRKRQTYWLAEEEIDMVDELAEALDMPKYQVVGAAVKLLYRRLLEG